MQRLSSLLILSQVVNQFTEVLVPYVIDRFYSSSQKELKEDDPAADHMQAEGSLPQFPVSSPSLFVYWKVIDRYAMGVYTSQPLFIVCISI